MNNVTFYKNGFIITGHTRPDICSELSLFAWTVASMILNMDSEGEYYTSPDDNSDVGYGHLIFDSNTTTDRLFELAKLMLPVWAKRWEWEGFVQIAEKDEMLVIPDDFKRINGIEVS